MDTTVMLPHPFDGTMNTFTVWCKRCGRPCGSADVSAVPDEPAGSFYCQHCTLFRGTPHPRLDGSRLTEEEFQSYVESRIG